MAREQQVARHAVRGGGGQDSKIEFLSLPRAGEGTKREKSGQNIYIYSRGKISKKKVILTKLFDFAELGRGNGPRGYIFRPVTYIVTLKKY